MLNFVRSTYKYVKCKLSLIFYPGMTNLPIGYCIVQYVVWVMVPGRLLKLTCDFLPICTVYMQPVVYEKHDMKQVYVDGGLNANYPLYCFDGKWFDMWDVVSK